jgi:hypothetical protein
VQPSDQKRVVLSLLLNECPFVHVFGNMPEVTGLPKELRHPELVLRLGMNPSVINIPDLVLDEAGFYCTISVAPNKYPIRVPWHAVGRFWIAEPFKGPVVVWEHVLPAAAQPTPEKPSGQALANPKAKPALRLVDAPPSGGSDGAA